MSPRNKENARHNRPSFMPAQTEVDERKAPGAVPELAPGSDWKPTPEVGTHKRCAGCGALFIAAECPSGCNRTPPEPPSLSPVTVEIERVAGPDPWR